MGVKVIFTKGVLLTLFDTYTLTIHWNYNFQMADDGHSEALSFKYVLPPKQIYLSVVGAVHNLLYPVA